MPAEWRLEDTDKRRLRHGGSMITTEKITTTDVKRFNKNRIFRLIHYADKISRQEIADILQLSLPTVNQNYGKRDVKVRGQCQSFRCRH